DGKNGLLEFQNGLWAPFVRKSALSPQFLVTSIFPVGKDSSFLTTVNKGFFILCHDTITPFTLREPAIFSTERVLTAIPVNKDRLAIGTNLGGAFIVNLNGEIIQNFSRREGLLNNNILKLFLDNNKNLWLGLDNGIDFIAYNNAVKHIYPEKLNEGLGYTAIVYNKELFVGTSNGLYSIPITDREDLSFLNGEFRSIPQSKGSTWGLSEVNGELLLGHHDGAFRISDGKLIPLDNRSAFWGFLPYSSVLPSSYVIAGSDVGIDLLEFEHGHFALKEIIPGFGTSAQFMALDNNNTIWVAHPYRGIYRIDMNDPAHPNVKLFTDKNGLPSYLKNHLFKIKSHIVVTTAKGIYEYDPASDKFVPSALFKTFFGERNIRHLKEDAAGNIWFVEDNNLGVVDLSGKNPETIYFPELSGKLVADYEHIYPYDKFNVFVGSEKGFYHINYEDYKKTKYPVQVKIREVRALGKTDSLLYGGYFGEVGENPDQPPSAQFNIASNYNSLLFKYTSPLYMAQNSIEYSYMLKGFDKAWSPWSKGTEKQYANIPSGVYTFQVRSRSNLRNISPAVGYTITILPPWYKTGWAYLLYILFLFGLSFILYYWQRRIFRQQQEKHEEEQRRLQYLHQLELEQSEKQIIELKNQKLEAEIVYKNTELASTAMHLVQKGELLGNIREELMRRKKGANGDGLQEEFHKLLKILSEENRMDKDWEQFAIHFDQVHSDFLQILKSIYPALSAHELKLCAYLRMSLSSKEIAQLENISVRGVELGRYRLRKKLKISTETNLFDFLMEMTTKKPN
ncbi:MAG TPA: triple tyrosine motif-containing protein, partial [Puia sp.]|nr:triple tyrosine motif-containing protein [Puia sp.]